ncbi:RICIN domain-containing protein [Streptomyces sp. NPDC059866]|uniref:RICIN domain-containing protein n=1 Tax=Streptomyces sp. NPDC059866 TaxID=3346978 RepID=UPI003648C150
MSIKMITRVSAAAATIVCALAFSTPADAAAVYARFDNVGTTKCLAVPNASKTAGTGLIQWTCGSGSEQMWKIEALPSGSVKITNENSQMCLAMPNGSLTNGTQVIQWPCNDNLDQRWIHDSANRLRNVNSDRCLAVANSDKTNGAEVIQWTCNTNTDQQWAW